MSNKADDISQAERRRVMANDRKVMASYHSVAQSSANEDRGGRFAFSGSSTTVVGSNPISYPTQPTHSPWHSNPYPDEPPLGYSVDEMEPVGKPFERGPPSTTALQWKRGKK
jgi:hypothetical protein